MSATKRSSQSMSLKKRKVENKEDKAFIAAHVLSFRGIHSIFSNFADLSLEVADNRRYSNGEAAFHGEKFHRVAKKVASTHRKRELEEYADTFLEPAFAGEPAKAKVHGGKRGLMLTKDEQAMWQEMCVDAQREISIGKFEEHAVEREALAQSGNKILVHSAARTVEKDIPKLFWEGKAVIQPDTKDIVVLGGNHLGKVWMNMRKEL